LKAREAVNFFEENVMAESDNVLTRLQDLLVYVIPQSSKFPREQKFVLGDRMTFRGLTGGSPRLPHTAFQSNGRT
jgi:hypothetical protein